MIMRMNAVQMVVRLHCLGNKSKSASPCSVQASLFNIVNHWLDEAAEVKPGGLQSWTSSEISDSGKLSASDRVDAGMDRTFGATGMERAVLHMG